MSAGKSPLTEGSLAPARVATPMARQGDVEGDGSRYKCARCGHLNPGEDRFCGMCGAAHGKTVTAPARRATDHGSTPLSLTGADGSKHYHFYYHHHHYRGSLYLIVSIALLLAVIAWRSGWDYGLRTSTPPTATLPATATSQSAPAPAGPYSSR